MKLKYEKFRLTEQEAHWIDTKQVVSLYVNQIGSRGDWISKVVILGTDENWYYLEDCRDNPEWVFHDDMPKYIPTGKVRMVRRDLVTEISEYSGN